MKHSARWTSVVALVALLQMALPVRPAHALVGVGTANPGLMIAGGVVMGAAVIHQAIVEDYEGKWMGARSSLNGMTGLLVYMASWVLSGAVFLTGLIILPEESATDLQLPALIPSVQAELQTRGANAHMLAHYEDERAELQLLSQEVAQELRQRWEAAGSPAWGSELSPETWMQWSAEAWGTRKAAVSTEAFNVLGMIASLALEKAQSK